MDTVTEARLAIAIAREGGIGIVHRNLSIADQVAEVDKVKRSRVRHDRRPRHARTRRRRWPTHSSSWPATSISGVPITDADGSLVGILTNRDLRFGASLDQPHPRGDDGRWSRHRARRHHARGGRATSSARHRIEKLPIVDDGRHAQRPHHRQGHPEAPSTPARHQGRAAAGCGSAPPSASAPMRSSGPAALVDAGVDVLVVDTAHGHSRAACSRWCDAIKSRLRRRGDRRQRRHRRGGRGAHRAPAPTASRSASGPGSICTTRVVAGVGVPQITAIYDCAEAARATACRSSPTAASSYSGDIAKAIAAGADTVMLGSAARRRRRVARATSSCTRASASRSTAAWARWAP